MCVCVCEVNETLVYSNCSAVEFACVSTGTCIALTDVCDNIAHCDDASDEAFCTSASTSHTRTASPPALPLHSQHAKTTTIKHANNSFGKTIRFLACNAYA